MLIKLRDIVERYNLNIRGVLHIGAHWGQEYKAYEKEGVPHMLFFEPVAAAYQKLIHTLPKKESVRAYKLALGNSVGEKVMYVETENRGMSSSLMRPTLHLQYSPEIRFKEREVVQVQKLDNVEFNRANFNMINIDVQGYEMQVFKGATKTLKTIDIIYSEVNFEELYKGCAMVWSVDEFLRAFNFVRVVTKMAHKSWGDALYLKYE